MRNPMHCCMGEAIAPTNKRIGVDAGRRPATCETPCSNAWGKPPPSKTSASEMPRVGDPQHAKPHAAMHGESLPHKQAHRSNRGSETRSMRNPMQQCMGKASALKNKRVGVDAGRRPAACETPCSNAWGKPSPPQTSASEMRRKNQRGSNRTIAGRIRGATES